jgi:glutamate synthase domain-containing protein 3
MVELEYLENPDEIAEIREMIERHTSLTGSKLAERILRKWDDTCQRFIKVMPRDYKNVLQAIRQVEASGITGEEAVMAAFELNTHAVLRASGN